jgi:hypothetical protein
LKYFISRRNLDLIYFEQAVGGHALAGAFSAPPLYQWLFDHSLAVPEPGALLSSISCLLFLTLTRRRRTGMEIAPLAGRPFRHK